MNLKKYQLRHLIISTKTKILLAKIKTLREAIFKTELMKIIWHSPLLKNVSLSLMISFTTEKAILNQGSIQKQDNTKSQTDVVPQVNESFIQKIQDMTIKGLNLPLQKELITKKLKITREIIPS